MDTGDVLSSAIAAVSLIATAVLAYRQTRLQARLTAMEAARRREEIEARQHADVRAIVAGTPTALQLVLANDGPATAWEVWLDLTIRRCSTAWMSWSRPQPRSGQGIGFHSRS
jgi:hypothetical protein